MNLAGGEVRTPVLVAERISKSFGDVQVLFSVDFDVLPGEVHALMGENGAEFASNHAGGILGGISTGQAVTARVAFKPTSSILTPRRSLDEAGQEIELRTKGRHDPCVGIRAVPVAEAMVACVLAAHLLRHRALGRG